MASSHNESFVIFEYADIRWTTRDLAGVNAGDSVNHITIPGSLTPSILDIEDTSNVDVPGRWIFKVGEGTYLLV